MDYPSSAFLAVSRQDSVPSPQLVPIGSSLIPQSLQSAFGIPCMNLDVRDFPVFPSSIPPPFRASQENIFASWPASLDHQQNYLRVPLNMNITEALPLERSGKSANQGPELQPLSNVIPEQVPTASEAAKPVHKPRVVWTEELHQRFLRAIEAAGSEEAAVPTVILKLMNVSGLSRDNVASHLQKHRLGLKRGKCNKRRAQVLHTGKQKHQKSEDASAFAQDVGTGEEDIRGISGAWCSERPQSNAAEAPDSLQPPQQYGRGEGNKRVPSEQAEGEGQDCAGSNERDGCDGNDAIGSSDDGAGAGSDNRASACNGGVEKHAAEASGNPGQEQQVPATWRPSTDPPAAEATRGALQHPHPGQQPTGGERVRGDNTRSPNESGCGSNAASKQARNSGGVSDLHGSAPTAGSGTAADGRQVSQAQRPGVRDLAAMEPVGKPISLPMPPIVPAANATPMEAPRTGVCLDAPVI